MSTGREGWSGMPAKRGLILGGTGEARQLAEILAGDPGFALVTSLAGVTSAPNIPTGEIRKGGFGGWDGLAKYLKDEKIDFLVDGTHPFAVRISRHAVAACELGETEYFSLLRAPWEKRPEDNWIPVADMTQAAEVVPARARAFLTIGRKDIPAFLARTDVTWTSRSIESLDLKLPANWSHLEARPPFSLEDELAFLELHKFDVLITKNSGGATGAKLEAARQLSVPVIMVARPTPLIPASAETAPDMAKLLQVRFATI
ncbi:MAG: cobalt-precorrin-6A reductase [Alphaproteobacteria bacterium]